MSANQEFKPIEDAKRRVTRFLVELIGYNLSVDMKGLSSAMESASPNTSPLSFTLSAEDIDELHELASLTTLLHEKVATNDINSVSKAERQLLFHRIIQPAEALHVSGAFALSPIGEYAAHQCDPTKRNKTHLSWATPPRPFIWFLRFATANVLFTFSQTILNIAPNEKVQFVLGAALRKYQIGVFGPWKMNLLGWELKWRGFDCREGFIELKEFCCKGETGSHFWGVNEFTEKNFYRT